jgi:hypothetical protein
MARSSSNLGVTRKGRPRTGDEGREEALAQAPRDAREVDHRGATGEHQRVHALCAHEPPRLLETRLPFGDADRHHAVLHGAQRRDGRGEVARALRRGLVVVRRARVRARVRGPGAERCGGAEGGGGGEEAAAVGHGGGVAGEG